MKFFISLLILAFSFNSFSADCKDTFKSTPDETDVQKELIDMYEKGDKKRIEEFWRKVMETEAAKSEELRKDLQKWEEILIDVVNGQRSSLTLKHINDPDFDAELEKIMVNILNDPGIVSYFKE